MKKFLSALICLLLLCTLAMPAFAAGLTITFTDDSLPEVGGTLTVDEKAMLEDGSITADIYNALLEGNVIYSWYKNDMLTQEGTAGSSNSYPLTLSDQGCTIYVVASFFEDSSFQPAKQCGEATSAKITVTGPAPRITTSALPDATVGKAYYIRLECSDADAVFSEIMGSQLSEFGLCLTQHGEIEGTPTKSGNCHVNVHAASEGGGEDSVSYDITVKAAPPAVEVEITTQSLPEAVVGKAYHVTLGCTDGNAKFNISYNPGKANDFDKTGLTLNDTGIISGTPTAAGSYTFCVCAAGADGEDYMVYTLAVRDVSDEAAPTATPEATPAATPDATSDPAPAEPPQQMQTPEGSQEDAAFPWWGYLLVILGGITTGIGIALIFIKLKKKS